MGASGSETALRRVLAAGAGVFLLSALCLLVGPAAFADALGLAAGSSVEWALRMVGACLLAVAGLMWLVRRADDAAVRGASAVMLVAGGAMTVLTIVMPGTWAVARWAYLAVGLAFIVAYAVLLRRGVRR